MDIDDIGEETAEALLTAAQDIVKLATDRARAITPKHVVPSVLSIIETAHASLIAAAVLAQYGERANEETGHALGIAHQHLGYFAKVFVANGVKLIESGELPPEYLSAVER